MDLVNQVLEMWKIFVVSVWKSPSVLVGRRADAAGGSYLGPNSLVMELVFSVYELRDQLSRTTPARFPRKAKPKSSPYIQCIFFLAASLGSVPPYIYIYIYIFFSLPLLSSLSRNSLSARVSYPQLSSWMQPGFRISFALKGMLVSIRYDRGEKRSLVSLQSKMDETDEFQIMR